MIVIGVVITAMGSGVGAEGVPITSERARSAAVLATLSAASFGIGLYALGRISSLLPTAWAVLPPRVVGVILVAIPLAAVGRMKLTRAAAPYVVAVGMSEVIGYAFYATGAHVAIAITAVLATLFAPLSSIAAFVLFRERIARRQVAGIGLVVLGVALLAAVQG